jgi:hypothetical protein
VSQIRHLTSTAFAGKLAARKGDGMPRRKLLVT